VPVKVLHTGGAVQPETQENAMTAIRPYALLALALFAAPTGAQELGAVRGMDANGDGTISKAEAQAFYEARFKEADTNHDGVLSEDEFVNAGLKRLSALDKNGDGQITRDEIREEVRDAVRGRFSR
jgi:hypothetical protein